MYSPALRLLICTLAHKWATNSARCRYEARRVRLSAVMFANVPRNAHCMRTMGTGSLAGPTY